MQVFGDPHLTLFLCSTTDTGNVSQSERTDEMAKVRKKFKMEIKPSICKLASRLRIYNVYLKLLIKNTFLPYWSQTGMDSKTSPNTFY